jgi:uncharacterized protein YfaS (alpha-2-macroglobulin family)/TolA-binding protein
MNPYRFAPAILLAAVLGRAVPLAAAEPATPDVPLVGEKIRQAMQDAKYPEAIAAIKESLPAKDAAKDYLTYLMGRALYLQKEYDQAAAAFDQLQKDYPQSPWCRHARFAKALALARKGDFRSAELIFRGEAEYLLSAERKQQIADIYLEFADNYFKPPKEEQKPDYQKALNFYQKALEVGPKAEKRIEVELLVAQCQQKLGKLDEAAAGFEKFIKEHGQSPLDVEARFLLGQCRLAQGNLKLARRVWQDLLAKYLPAPAAAERPAGEGGLAGGLAHRAAAGDAPAPKPAAKEEAPPKEPLKDKALSPAAERKPAPAPNRVAEAAYNLARTWNLPRPNSDEELSLGTAALENFIERFPLDKLASKAHLEIAAAFMFRGRYEDAVQALRRLLGAERYKDREEIPDARNLLGRCYQLQKKFPEALAAWQEYLAKHPAHRAWSAVQRQIVGTEFLMAAERLQAKQYDAARKAFEEFLAKYPLDARDPDILLLVARSYVDQEQWDAAIAEWRRLVSKYPRTEPASLAQYSIADTLEKKLGKLEEALEEYRKVTWGSHAGQARQAIARLTAKSMTVATERVFRSDEAPKIKLTSRNIESVTVRAYKIDLETYFRKMHLAGGVEGLDIALIDPDRSFEFKVPGYAKYQELESAVEVPLPAGPAGPAKAGVMAVTVSSKTLEATTLVLQSDLDVLVKTSRDEVFVFAENMLTGKPWPKVRLLLSNGRQVFAEGVTGADGVFRTAVKRPAGKDAAAGADDPLGELRAAQDVRVFAMAEGHVASSVVGLQGVGVAAGLADKGYIYTDRPAYRAGQLVHVRGCLRHAADDRYTIQQGKKFTVEVFDSRNRLVRQEPVQLGDFGSFHIHFALPATSPQGQYRVLVHDEDGKQNYQGTFQVHQYQIEPIHLVVDTPRTVYYRGEEIEGTIRAAFYYGAPLVGREVRYQLADERQFTATTDERGEVKFKLPTREFSETQILPLVVTLPERNLTTTVNLVLATRGFSVGVTTVRPVYVAGETFEVKLSTRDAEDKPLAQKLVLKVLERTVVEGKVGERPVEDFPLETDKDGIARKTLKLEKGGSFVLRAEGTDRFHNPVSGQSVVQVSDEEDAVRLRILADAHTFKVGDTGKVEIHWREEPALALVTFQGAHVLDYQLVPLVKGANALAIPMTAALAPNFELAVAVMTDPRPDKDAAAKPQAKGPAGGAKPQAAKRPIVRFHEATSPFTVERDLRVKLAVRPKGDAKGPVRPGDQVEVALTTTDLQGKPVAAELSLAMIEQSLLDRFPWEVAGIQDFFRGQPRQSAMRSAASITFAYRPSTQAINPRLLAEQDRLEIAKEEEESRRLAVMPTTPAPAAPEPAVETPAVPADPQSLANAAADVQVDQLQQLAQAEPQAEEAALREQNSSESDADQTLSLGYMNAPARQAGEKQAMQSASSGRRVQRLVQSGGFAYGGGAGQQLAMGRIVMRSQNLESQLSAQAWQIEANPNDNPTNLSVNADGTLNLSGGNLYTGNANLNAGTLNALVANNQGQIVVLDNSGNMKNVQLAAGGEWNEAKAQAMAEDLARSGAVLLSAMLPQETGYWNPSVVTGKDGKATLEVTVPERSTAWKLLARGITVDTLAGEAAEPLVVKKELFGQLKLPMSFTDGDEAEVLATVHNDAIDKGPIEVTLRTVVGGRVVEEKKTIEAKAKGIEELVFKMKLDRPEPPKGDQAAAPAPETTAIFELLVQAGQRKDVVRQMVPLKPYGMPVYAAASGSATSDVTAWVEPPAKMDLDHPSLEILIGPTVQRSLMDIVLAPAPWCQIEAGRLTTGLETAASDLMAALALQKLLAGTRQAGGPEAQALDAAVRANIGLVVSAQNDDGGWAWTGGGTSERFTSARIAWALVLAKRAGYTVPQDSYAKTLTYLQNQVAAAAESDYDAKAVLLHALSAASQGDFALANRLYRNRPALSAGALAYLALAFIEMDRKATAAELVELLGQKNLDDAATRRASPQAPLPWCQAPAELRALYALAAEEAVPKAPKTKQLVDWLLAHRTGHRWLPEKATGPAALALVRWFAENRFEGEHYQLAVFVNDVRVKVLDVDPAALTQTIAVPAATLKKAGKQRINFQLTGRGQFTYQCVLGGFVPAEKLAGTTEDWKVERTYQPAPLEVDGHEVPRGFGVLEGGYSEFRNPLTQLPVGRRGVVELSLKRNNVPLNTPADQLEYLVVTEPIPSGATVIERSVQGGFERFDIGPGAITFYVGSRQYPGTIRYELYGYLPGKYRAAPTVVRNAYRPEQLAVAAAKPLDVLPLGAASADPYRLTPQELYELGKREFDAGRLAEAGKHLGELVAKWNLKADVYKHAVGMLLDVHLATGPAGQIVRWFEIIKEKWPSEEIPFAKIVKVAAAYHDIGEYERSYLVFRATVEGSFARESRVAGFLEEQGEFLRSVAVLDRLLREYPPENYAAAAAYALAQRVYAKAPEAAGDEGLRKAKVNRVDLVRRAWAMLESFLTAYPDDPAADQAAFAAANALLDLRAYKECIAGCNQYARRYPKSDLVDSYWYVIGYCHFALGEHKDAMELCRKVAEAMRTDKSTGRQVESPNKWQAVYILAQVYHSEGAAAEAIREYRRVEDRFPDARQSIDYFLRKAIELPEVSTVRPGAAAEVELRFRNVAACDCRVYRIDLMKFSLLRRNLAGITSINLSGIRPYHEAAVALGDGKDYRDRTHKLPLPLKEEGAYLVVCRGDDLHASGLVLVTPLAVEIQEEASSGRVRTTVKDAQKDEYVRDARVKVIGSRNEDFVSGATDLRGVFVADGIRGSSTVIAQIDPSRYAFFRGKTELGPPPEAAKVPQAAPPPQSAAAPSTPAAKASRGLEESLLENVKGFNKSFQGRQNENIDKMYKGKGEGVKAESAF